MQEFLSNLFSEITNEESIYFLAFLLGAFLIGFIISWLLWGSVARRRKKEADQLRAQLSDLEKEHATLKERLGMKEADLQKAALELEESTEKVRRLQEEKGSLYAQWQTERDKAAKLEAGMNSYQNTIDDLNDQILGLKNPKPGTTDGIA
jgi:flagellar motility protein MotE (MotC chaperone)